MGYEECSEVKFASPITKDTIRRVVWNNISRLTVDELNGKSRDIEKNVLSLEEVKKAKTLGCYFSLDNEVLTNNLICNFLFLGKQVFLPRVVGAALQFRKINSIDSLMIGKFGIREPDDSCIVMDNVDLDCLIIPCVSVDIMGNRVGRGKGYYDRFISAHRYLRVICLAFNLQVFGSVQSENFDERVDVVVTESSIIAIKE